MSTLISYEDLLRWVEGSAAQLGDPSKPVCQMFFKWQDPLPLLARGELACGMDEGRLVLDVWPGKRLPIPVDEDLQVSIDDEGGDLLAYGLAQLCPGVWAMTPSLFLEGDIHGFVVLYNVPEPAPFERRIVLAQTVP